MALYAVPLYLLFQLIGAVLAFAEMNNRATGSYFGDGAKQFLVKTPQDVGMLEAGLAEAKSAAVLAFAVCLARFIPNKIAAAAVVGASLFLAIGWSAPISGGSVNPALALAPHIVAWSADGLRFTLVAYVFWPMVGAGIVGLLCLPLRRIPPAS